MIDMIENHNNKLKYLRDIRPKYKQYISIDKIANLFNLQVINYSNYKLSQIKITGISLDSREILRGDLFVAMKGRDYNGAKYIKNIITIGVGVILTNFENLSIVKKEISIINKNNHKFSPTILISNHNIRSTINRLAKYIYSLQIKLENKNKNFKVLGITGTNGKTTTVYLIYQLYKYLSKKIGVISTVSIFTNLWSLSDRNNLTTPESTNIYSILNLMKEDGMHALAMEVSSHAVKYNRINGINFNVMGFTNLSQDHLDLHDTMSNYFKFKSKLFNKKRTNISIICIDNKWGRVLVKKLNKEHTSSSQIDKNNIQTFGYNKNANWIIKDVSFSLKNFERKFIIKNLNNEKIFVKSPLIGKHNVYNLTLAILTVLSDCLISIKDINKILQLKQCLNFQIPGRMEIVKRLPLSIIDFAHNPEALKYVLQSLKPICKNKIIIVFGATGERDKSKREPMGSIASKYADIVIVTDDNPYREDDKKIRKSILDGALKNKNNNNLSTIILEIPSRIKAIKQAVYLSNLSDTIIVAGRGHEIWQNRGKDKLYINDKLELKKALRSKYL